MWVDENGGGDATDTTGAPDEMTVTVEGEDYSADVNFDLNEDGVDDTAIVEHDDGSAQAFIDNDGDGHADEYAVLDAQGNVTTHATYDEASGDWVSSEGGHGGDGGDSGDTQTGSGGTIHADMPDGDVEVGPATVDTNHDGVNDTAVVEQEDGSTIAFTDENGDGQADVAVVIAPDGSTTTLEHTGDGEWTETGNGSSGASAGSDSLWGGGGQDTVEGVAKIDSATGQWISQN